jgi:tetratricopeptide (TPR) repeat protein
VRISTIRLLFSLLALLAPLAGAAQSEPSGHELPPGIECIPALSPAEEEILRLWISRGYALQAGNAEEAERVLEQARDEMEAERLERLPEIAGALMVESERFRLEKNYGKASSAALWATRFDPLSAKARFQLARVRWRAEGEVVGGLKAWLAGVRLSFEGFWRSYVLLGNFLVVLGLALILSGSIASIVLLIRHGPAFRHEIFERLPRIWPSSRRRTVAGAILFIPLVLFIGGAWVLLWWPVVLVRHASRAERGLVALGLALLILSGPALAALDRYLAVAVSPTARVLAAAEGSRAEPTSIEQIQRLAAARPEVAPYHFLLGNLYASQMLSSLATAEDRACFLLAESEYFEAIRLDAGEHRFRINLGNLYFRNGSYREAWTRYREALDLGPESILAAYNLATAYGEDVNRLMDKEQILDSARARDAAELERLLEKGGEGKAVVDAQLTLGEMSRLVLSESMGEAAAEQGVWSDLRRPSSVAGMAAAVLALLVFLGVGSRPARRCDRCGRPFCFRCKTGREGPESCPQCMHLFLKKDGLAPGVRGEKLQEIDRFERWGRLGRALARLLAPGADRLLAGRTASGALLLLLWTLGLSWIFLGGTLLVPPDLPLTTLGRPSVPVIVALMGLLWLALNLPRPRHRSRKRA